MPNLKKYFLIICLLSFAASFGIGKTLAITNAPGLEKPPTPPITSEYKLITTSSLEQQAQQLYQTGQFTQAIPILQQAITEYAAVNDSLAQARALRNLALVYQELGNLTQVDQAITQSLNLLANSPNNQEKVRLQAQILDLQGQSYMSRGKPKEALDTWKQATKIYQQTGDVTGITRGQINQAQALQALGLYSQAHKNLAKIQETLDQQEDTLLKAKALQSLGDVLRGVGQFDNSQEVLEQSLAISEKLRSPEAIATSLISLGNTARANQKPGDAQDFYQRAQEKSPTLEIRVQALLNELSLLVKEKHWSELTALLPKVEQLLEQLPPSQQLVYAQINLAGSLMQVAKEELDEAETYKAKAAQLLAEALGEAKDFGDPRAQAYALGNLGSLYEQDQRWDEARRLTEKALMTAQAIQASDIAYQWQWQLGRILKAQGNREGAIAAYSQSVRNLGSLRSDLVSISSDVKFSFRESVEPVYRELVDLLLKSGSVLPKREDKSINFSNGISQENLKQARKVIESLQLAELDNFFRDACLDAKPMQIDQLDSTAAIFYTIILPDGLEVILSLPGKQLRHYTVSLQEEEIEATLKTMREALTFAKNRLLIETFLQPSQEVYDWLIRPVESELADGRIKNLVFVLDGGLRNLPMASLYDGQQYLAEKYAVATAPTLQLVDPKPLARQKIKVLAAGISKSRGEFGPLPGVESELKSIKVQVDADTLLNEDFTEKNFNAKVNNNSYQVVHLATHGRFSSKAENTFILTWDDRINIDELSGLLNADRQQTNPVELLILSACQTAAGDKRAALGLAGVAVRAGARSTVASLWFVDDEATALLMTKLYQELDKPNVTKAEALRRAQAAVLQNDKFSHPYFWSAFVLVGNWL
ncbi:MAG: CHAT domain-containing protein [Coleofasciculaceae cyanobacterium]